MRYLKADTAATVRIGPAVSISDGYTLLATLAISTADYAYISDAAGTETDISANTWAAVTSVTGWYDLTLTAGQLGTEGPLTVMIYDVSLCLPIHCHFHVVNANVYDSLFAAAATDYLQTDVAQWLSAAVTLSSTTSKPEIDVFSISDDSTAANNLELQYDTTGLTGDYFPATQIQVGRLAVGSSAISTVAESHTLTTGTEVNDYTVTDEVDGVYHEISDSAGALEVYYQFDVGGNGIASEVAMTGRLEGGNDLIGVYAYNWTGAVWDQIGSLQGSGSTADGKEIFSLLTRHTGSGANLGKVRVRGYAASGLTTATLYLDQAYVSYSVITKSVGYANGAVWIDTADGVAGTEAFVNGTADNPSDTLADAITIAAAVNLERFEVSPDSSITFAEAHVSEVWRGDGWALALGGQDISKTHIYHCNDVSGTGTCATGETHIINSHIGVTAACTLGQAHITGCTIGTNGLVLSQAGNYIIEDTKSGIAGATAPTIDMGAAVAGSSLSVRNWSGGITLNNLASGDVVTLEGIFGTVTLNGADAQVEIRGIAKSVVNNLTGSPTVNDNSVKSTSIESILVDTGTTLPSQISGLNNISQADVRSATGLAAANLDTQLSVLNTAVVTDIPASIATANTTLTNLNNGIIYDTAATGTLSTTEATTNLSGYADDQLIGRTATVLTGAAAGESFLIEDYFSTGGKLVFTTNPLTTPMSNGDAFKIT